MYHATKQWLSCEGDMSGVDLIPSPEDNPYSVTPMLTSPRHVSLQVCLTALHFDLAYASATGQGVDRRTEYFRLSVRGLTWSDHMPIDSTSEHALHCSRPFSDCMSCLIHDPNHFGDPGQCPSLSCAFNSAVLHRNLGFYDASLPLALQLCITTRHVEPSPL
jgi:hypothetical protein